MRHGMGDASAGDLTICRQPPAMDKTNINKKAKTWRCTGGAQTTPPRRTAPQATPARRLSLRPRQDPGSASVTPLAPRPQSSVVSSAFWNQTVSILVADRHTCVPPSPAVGGCFGLRTRYPHQWSHVSPLTSATVAPDVCFLRAGVGGEVGSLPAVTPPRPSLPEPGGLRWCDVVKGPGEVRGVTTSGRCCCPVWGFLAISFPA